MNHPRVPPIRARQVARWPRKNLLLARLIGVTSVVLPGACARVDQLPDSAVEPEPSEECKGETCEEPAADCKRSSDCDAGELCSADGECEREPGDNTINVGGLGGKSSQPPTHQGGQGPGCVDVQVEYEPVVPTVLLLVDQSGSMTGGMGFGALVEQEIESGDYEPWGCPSDPEAALDATDQQNPAWRWNVLRNVLFNPSSGVVSTLDDQVRFGMSLYTSRGGFGTGEQPNVCPVVTSVEVALGAADEMLAAMKCDDIVLDTPTREALAETADQLAELEATGPKILILATDGEPDSCQCPHYVETAEEPCQPSTLLERGGDELSPDQAEQYDVVEESRRIYQDLAIEVFVIDVSTPSNTSFRAHLNEVAEAGGGELFDGTRPTQLRSSFRSIIDGVRSCAVDLNGAISRGREDSGTIVLDDQELVRIQDGEGDGYVVRSATRIELQGDPCEEIKQGGHELSITFPCDAIEIIR